MALRIGRISVQFRQFIAVIFLRDKGQTVNRFAALRLLAIKPSQRTHLASVARRIRVGFGTLISSSLLASRGIGFWSSSASSQTEEKDTKMAEKDTKSSSDAEIIEEAERLYQTCEWLKLRDFLQQHKDSNNEEILWRLCRANRDVAQMKTTTAEDKKKLTYESLDYAKRCLEINENNFACHKWYAICISEVGDYEGSKIKVANAYVIKEHFQKAIDLNPNDATCHHLMGLWCFTFADMPWYQRKIAAVVFGTPPTSTYEEAYAHFKKGEDISPGFFVKNLVMLGKTCQHMKNNEEAKGYLKKALDYPCKKDEDTQAVKEAEQLLKE